MGLNDRKNDIAFSADAARKEHVNVTGIRNRVASGIDPMCRKRHVFFQNFKGDRIAVVRRLKNKIRKACDIAFSFLIKLGKMRLGGFSDSFF